MTYFVSVCLLKFDCEKSKVPITVEFNRLKLNPESGFCNKRFTKTGSLKKATTCLG